MMLGQNGTGKTTLIKMLAGILKPDDEKLEMPKLSISYKPQTIAPKFQGSVQELLYTKLKDSWNSSIFKTEVLWANTNYLVEKACQPSLLWEKLQAS